MIVVLHEVRGTVECGTFLSERRAWAKVEWGFVAVLRAVALTKGPSLE